MKSLSAQLLEPDSIWLLTSTELREHGQTLPVAAGVLFDVVSMELLLVASYVQLAKEGMSTILLGRPLLTVS